jgi:hypothetical protein
MEQERFDSLTRVLAGQGGRRSIFRLLLGSAVTALAARLDLTETVQATRQHRRRRRDSGHGPKPGRSQHAQAAGKGKRKGNGRKNKRHHQSPLIPPLPPGCQNCNECQMCQDGACVPDSDLNGIICQGSGAACGYCQGGLCAPSLISPCADGFCPSRQNQCCADEKLCPDHESSTGVACIPKENCCPDSEQRCGGICVSRTHCCPEAPKPICASCEQLACRNGVWVCQRTESCGVRCGEGYCSDGLLCHHEGVCCGVPTGGTYWTCECASGYTGGCNGGCCRTGCCYPFCCEDVRAIA